MVIDFILNKINWGTDKSDLDTVGFQPLIDKGVYKAAFSLHDVSVLVFNFFFFLSKNESLNSIDFNCFLFTYLFIYFGYDHDR